MESKDKKCGEKIKELPLDFVKYSHPVMLVERTEESRAAQGAIKKRPLLTKDLLERKCQSDLLNSMWPPRTFEKDGKIYRQTVSNAPATREEVVTLHQNLETLLRITEARQTGICPMRREIYARAFDELIRQITVENSERGLLLMRIRDEILMSLESYETLYKSSVPFGPRKLLIIQDEKDKLIEEQKNLEASKEALEREIFQMQLETEVTEKRKADLLAAEEEMCTKELAFEEITGDQLEDEINRILEARKFKNRASIEE